MNKLKYFAVVVVLFLSSVLEAQVQKIGHMDMQYVLEEMPEMKQVRSQLQTLQSQLEKQAELKQKSFEEKYNKYIAEGAQIAEAIRIDMEKELAQMQQSAQEFSTNAQQTLQQKETQLMKPIYDKIGKAIGEVANEGSYSYIFNAGVPGLDILYFSNPANDTSNAILKKMGISPPVVPNTTE